MWLDVGLLLIWPLICYKIWCGHAAHVFVAAQILELKIFFSDRQLDLDRDLPSPRLLLPDRWTLAWRGRDGWRCLGSVDYYISWLDQVGAAEGGCGRLGHEALDLGRAARIGLMMDTAGGV
ncbi:hypothetical protein ACLOJK_034276 [Asimina triloba]